MVLRVRHGYRAGWLSCIFRKIFDFLIFFHPRKIGPRSCHYIILTHDSISCDHDLAILATNEPIRIFFRFCLFGNLLLSHGHLTPFGAIQNVITNT